jgi:hypothetical protein
LLGADGVGVVGAGPAGFGREAQAARDAAAKPISASLAARLVSKFIQFLLKTFGSDLLNSRR